MQWIWDTDEKKKSPPLTLQQLLLPAWNFILLKEVKL
ncbi:uncharacterized protein FIBRA_09256 [Fibroporia radiculosa]|uniref:Uncharacterized protein n=1 Tax=Fibroporia radiculosa TaxID=599839 RepID=J7RH92_9APHY|nr:uncharacterized protein FIBRA_09256 [Fibroporia radiculosa]CCM06942.1 predicted protein [Fibroporia radiculosa]